MFANILLGPALIYQATVSPEFPQVSVGAGFLSQSPHVVGKSFPASEQQYSAFAPYIAPPPANGIGNPGTFSAVLWRAPIVYQAGVTPLRPQAAAATPSVLGWGTSSPAFAQFAISLGDGGELAGFVNYQPQGWWPSLEYCFAARFPVAIQPYSAFAPYIAPPPANGIGNPGQFSSALWRPPIVYQAGVSPLIPQTAAAAPSALGFQSDRFAVPFPAAAQQYYSFTPTIAPPSANGIGDPGSFNGVLWRAPIVYQAGVSPPPPQTAPPQGWWFDPPSILTKPFPAAAQQYETTARRQIASPVTPQGWNGYQLDYRFSVPYPASAQPFSVVAQLFLPPAANGIGDPGQFSSVISLPSIIYQAGVLPLAPPAVVKPPVVEPPPGHGDWPHRHKKPKVRPVWDRRPDADRAPEPAPHTAPSVRVPVEAKPPGTLRDPAGLRRLLAPELPKPAVAPPPKAEKPRPPVAVTATLSDADDGIEAVAGRGIMAVALGIDADDSVRAIAHGVVAAVAEGTDQADESITGRVNARIMANEEDDSISTQSASDDDIAFSLLFGDNDDELALALLFGDGGTADNPRSSPDE